MATKISIINRALVALGRERIISPIQETERGRVLNEHFNDVRDEVLREHTWNSAGARAVISEDLDKPAFEFSHQYSLPTDPYCLRVVKIHEWDGVWQVEGRKIVTDAPPPIRLKYVKRITSISEMDPLLATAISLKLAIAAWTKLAEDGKSLDRAIKTYEGTIATARSTDGQEGWMEEFWEDDFLESRD